MHRVWIASLLASAAVVFAAAAYLLLHTDAPPGEAGSAGQVGGAGAGSTGGTPTASIPSTPGNQPHLVVAFLGDDWTAGTGASAPAKRFSTLVSKQLHLTEHNFGGDGSGYAKAGPSSGPYRTRLAALVATHPDVVVVSGGRNDRVDFGPTAAAAARQLFTALHDKLPDATLIAITPFWGDSDQPPEITTLATAVKNAVTHAGGHYLGLPDPLHGHADYMADAGDPNNLGYSAIASAVAPRIAALLPVS